jgi:anti-sigma factor (TIGR02949 family)
MNCEELRAALPEHLAGRLDPERAAAAAAHLQGCPECSRKVCGASRTTCKEVAQFLLEYLDGELPQEQRAVFELHLDLCPPCVDYLAAYERTVELARDACTSEERPPVPEALVRAILNARRAGKDPRG